MFFIKNNIYSLTFFIFFKQMAIVLKYFSTNMTNMKGNLKNMRHTYTQEVNKEMQHDPNPKFKSIPIKAVTEQYQKKIKAIGKKQETKFKKYPKYGPVEKYKHFFFSKYLKEDTNSFFQRYDMFDTSMTDESHVKEDYLTKEFAKLDDKMEKDRIKFEFKQFQDKQQRKMDEAADAKLAKRTPKNLDANKAAKKKNSHKKNLPAALIPQKNKACLQTMIVVVTTKATMQGLLSLAHLIRILTLMNLNEFCYVVCKRTKYYYIEQ